MYIVLILFFLQELFWFIFIFFEMGNLIMEETFDFVFFFRISEFVQGGGYRGAEDDDSPDAIKPDEQNRQGCQSAVQHFICGAFHDNQPEWAAQNPEEEQRHKRAEKCVAYSHFFIRHQDIKEHKPGKVYQSRQNDADKILSGQDIRNELLQCIKVTAQGDGCAEQERPQGYDRPIKGDFCFYAAGLIYFKNKV